MHVQWARSSRAHAFVLAAALSPSIVTPTPAAARAPRFAAGAPSTSHVGVPARRVPAGIDLVVARDGSGDFATVQAALDALPAAADRTRVVLVSKGVYREKLFVTKSRVAIVGEDRDATRIEYAQLRREWRAEHPDDWGAAVVNVGDDVTDLLLANLTIRNDWGSRTGDHDHQFAIRSGGSSTRIVLLHANVLADGGDTVSFWNAFTGMTYHAFCTFEGWVDFVCPRGTSYVTNSRFIAHNLTAAIWHDGSRDRDHRFVVRSSRFDGDPGFPLGRNNRDGQFYLLDCALSGTMADQPIFQPSAPETYAWEPRAFFHGCRRDDGDLPWFADNLKDADFSPAPAEITPEWTFCGQWDPEGTMPAVLPFAAVPRPHDSAKEIALFGATLRWVAARGATGYELFFGSGSEPAGGVRLGAATTSWRTGPLAAGTRYAWRVDAINSEGRVRGETWSFTTAARPFRIALAGDSTVTERQGWETGFARRLGAGASCANHARGGRSTRSFVEEGHWANVLAERPDVVLIQFGHNDAPGKGPERETDPFTTYRDNLARMVDDARAVGARPVLLTPLTRRYVDEAGCVRSDLGFYADAARAVAFDRRVPLLDLHRLSIEAIDTMSPSEIAALGVPKEDGTLDRTHLSPAGSALFGALVAEELGRIVPDLAPAFDLSRAPAPKAAPASASGEGETAEPNVRSSAVHTLAPLLGKPAAWFSSPEAARVGENLLLWQRSSGGWPKDLDMALPLGPEQKATLLRRKDLTDTTIDNGATHTQIRFLARLFSAARDERFRAGAFRGIEFLLAAQYPNGGWPQFFPLKGDYSHDITFNDGAMAGALDVLLDVAQGREPFVWTDGDLRERARRAVGRGVEAILGAQVVVGGQRTAWGAQHDAETLEPSPARSFEPVALASTESVGVVRFLMRLPAPSRDVVAAVDSAVAWLRAVRIDGLRVERQRTPAFPDGVDVLATPDTGAPPVWARFYEIGTNRPLFSGRDGVVKSSLAEIEHERRTGYAWYVDAPASLLSKDYPAWKAKHATEVPR
jgi:PelA/Pel-15E family pectate lyase